ncbi:Cytochrome P450 monooxygenase abl5, partial [Plenodomus lingam]|uniref:Cytochrome P450 monooxygenase abl5 n=1 Tax=Leptosphaeria maculans (strain JN3 / isolate v23.1.3 / race Av1-4-5-6-7-8) TaxID=985895 RepID=ABL5_LEPMJ
MDSVRTFEACFLSTAAEITFFLKNITTTGNRAQSTKVVLNTLTAIVVVWICYRAVIYPKFISSLRHLPTAKRKYPLIGYGPAQFANSRGELFLEMAKAIPNEGLIRFHGFLETENLLLTSPEAIQEVLVKNSYNFIKPRGAKALFDRFLGSEVLFASEGPNHRNSKKHMQPPFNLSKVKILYSMFWDKAVKMSDDIGRSVIPSEKEILVTDVDMHAHNATLDAVMRALFGEKIEKSPYKHEILRLLDSVLGGSWDVTAYFMMTAFLPLWTLKLIPGGINDRVNFSSYRLRQSVRAFLNERKDESGSNKSDDIAMEMANSDYFTDDELVANLLGLMMAGIEPTAAGFVWIAWYLAIHPDWQTKVRNELKANIAHRFFTDDPTSFDAASVLESLPILNAVCNEGLRLKPPAPTSNRIAKFDTTILGHPVKAGTRIFISPFVSNRSEEFWGLTAAMYDPSRWLGDQKSGRKEVYNSRGGAATSTHCGFLPFLHGPRKCIGSIYAQAEMRAFIACLVGRFEFEMADKEEEMISAGILTSKPKGGLKLRLHKVKKW